MNRLITRVSIAAVLTALAGTFHTASATEDTDVPERGHFELKATVIGDRNDLGWEYAAPEIEFNYGLPGDTQLTAIIPWIIQHPKDEDRKNGWGTATVGFKWRFIDQEETSGFAASFFPRYSFNPVKSSERRGILSPTKELLVPLEFGFVSGPSHFWFEAGRNIVKDEKDTWLAGIKEEYQFTEKAKGYLEAGRSFPQTQAQTSLVVGVKWSLAEALVLKTGIGRDIGHKNEEQHNLSLEIGLEYTP